MNPNTLNTPPNLPTCLNCGGALVQNQKTCLNCHAPNHLYKEIHRASLILTITGLALWTPFLFWLPSLVLGLTFNFIFASTSLIGLGNLLTAVILSTVSEIGLGMAVVNRSRYNTKIAVILGGVGVALWVIRVIFAALSMALWM